MNSYLAYLLILLGGAYPFVGFLVLLAFTFYQLISGKLLNLTWGVWATRKEHPGKYWTVLAVEAAVVLIGLYVGYFMT